jgi:MATE family multidrug resistance protein
MTKNETLKTLKLAWPIILGQLSHIFLGVIDSVMVGQLGADELAAVSVSVGLFSILMVFGIGISFAISPLTAIARGAKDVMQTEKILKNGVINGLLVGIVLVLLMFFGADLLSFMQQTPRVTELSIPYLRILALSMLPIMIFQSFRQFSEGLEIMYPALILGLLMLPLNAFGNWLLISGNWGFPALGLEGAAWATTLTRLIVAIALAAYVLKNKRFAAFRQIRWRNAIDKQVQRRLLSLGIPGGAQLIFETSAFAFAAVMVGWLGSKPLAAHQIAINLASISFMVAIGLSSAGAIRIGHAKGQQNKQLIRKIGQSTLLLAAGFMALCGLFFIIARFHLAALYISDQEVINQAALLLLVAAAFQIADGIQAVGVGLLRGLEDVKRPTLYVMIAYWVLALPLGGLLAFTYNMGALGLWIALALGLATSAGLLSYRFYRLTR